MAAQERPAPRLTQRPVGADSALVAGVALLARVACLLWAGARFPPAADGHYYDVLARRVALGLGYTWLWPDGKVTFAAHYPVGYPALLGAAYAAIAPGVLVAGVVNALLGTAGAYATHRVAMRACGRGRALVAGLAVALHPGLVLYTPAVMTEAVTASLVALAAWAACVARDAARASDRDAPRPASLAALGLALGAATLVRPQSLLLAPLFAALTVPGAAFRVRPRATAAALVTGVALLVCAPWTARNCARMGRCALVSVNGGWNLLIGAGEHATGAWAPVDVPAPCREVWGEADKDECFGHAALADIASSPLHWISLVPAKLAATFDYCGAAGYYLHASNPDAFGVRAKEVLGVVETAYERFVYLGALAAAAFLAGPRRKPRMFVAAVGAVFLFREHAYLAVIALAVALGLLGRALLGAPALFGAAFAALAATLATHAVFFGAGRYGMVVFPLVTAMALAAGPGTARDTATATGAVRPRSDGF